MTGTWCMFSARHLCAYLSVLCAQKMVPVAVIYKVGMFFYNLLCKWPSTYWGTLNSAPTLCFAKAHCGAAYESRLRCVPSGTHEYFTDVPSSKSERQDVRRSRFG